MKKRLSKNIEKQYDNFAAKFSKLASDANNVSKKVFYDKLNFLKPNMKVLDLGCGDGADMLHYKNFSKNIFGIDPSEKMVELAKNILGSNKVKVGLGEKIPFPDKYFDVVLSKFVLQTSKNIDVVLKEVDRTLKPGGIFIYLAVHPFRQYFERRERKADYFKQKIVTSKIFKNKIILKEPSHTFSEYFNKSFLENFYLESFDEYFDPDAEAIDDKKYPGFFLVKAIKRK